MKSIKKFVATFILLVVGCTVQAQQDTISLSKAIGYALQNNDLLKIKKLQEAENKAKIAEAKVKAYPNAVVSSTYQYNVNTGELVIPAGSMGQLPLSPTNIISLPNTEKRFDLGEHQNFNAGLTVYQPITQQLKIRSGIDATKTDLKLSELERKKAEQQITLGVEKLYYGILIAQKQQEEAKAKIAAAKLKLFDVQSALLSGKTLDVNEAGLEANIANEEQELLKLQFQEEDYTAELKKVMGIDVNDFILADVEDKTTVTNNLKAYTAAAGQNNIDNKIAAMQIQKSTIGIKAAQQSLLPDVGVITGYMYQEGNILYPKHNPYVGLNFKWDIQSIFSNKQVLAQRRLVLQQAKENEANTQKEVLNKIEQAYRKLKQAEALIAVAQKARYYRTEELKIEEDRLLTGLSTKLKVLEAQSTLAKAEADLYAAKLNYSLSLSELKVLTQ